MKKQMSMMVIIPKVHQNKETLRKLQKTLDELIKEEETGMQKEQICIIQMK